MSWHFSRAMAAELSGLASWVGEQSAPSKSIRALEPPFSDGKTTIASHHSPSGTTSELSTGDHGVALWMLYLGASPANRLVPLLAVGTMPRISGPKCFGSLGKCARVTFSARTFSASPSSVPQRIYERRAIAPALLRSIRPSWLRRIAVSGGGWLPTPTAKANHDAPSMRKWPAYATYQNWLSGRTSPAAWEWMMDWPIGWTDSTASAMDSFHLWLSQHGAC